MKTRVKIFSIATLLLTLTLLFSCGPIARVLEVEKMVPSKYPIELENSSLALFFSLNYENDKYDTNYLLYNDSSLMAHVSKGIAAEMERQLLLDEGGVYVFSHLPEVRLYDDDYIRELSFISNSDIVIILDSLTLSQPQLLKTASINYGSSHAVNYIYSQIKSLLNIYDGITAQKLTSISQVDTMYWEVISKSDLTEEAIVARVIGSLSQVSTIIGNNIAKALFPSWLYMKRDLFIFPNNSWEEAYSYAEQFRWNEAMDIWMKHLESKDKVMTAAAAYNIAVACELTDRLELATQWIDVSYNSHVLPGVNTYKYFLEKSLEEERSK